MGNFQNNPRLCWWPNAAVLTAVGLATALWYGPAIAAEEKNNGPVPLSQPAASQPAPTSVPTSPRTGPPVSPERSPGGIRALAPAPGSGKGAIEMGQLSSVDVGDMGLLDIDAGGFGPEMWTGTQRFLVERLMPQIPMATTSPAMNGLARRFLLTRTHAPQGATAGQSILALRLKKLYEAGRLGDLKAFMAQLPNGVRNDGLLAAMAKSEIALGNLDTACRYVSAMRLVGVPGVDPVTTAGLKIRTLCRIHAADKSGASLVSDLLRDQDMKDPLFFALVGRLTSGLEESLDVEGPVEAVHLAMYVQSGLSLPDNIGARAESALWKQVLNHSSIDASARLSLVERASQRGMLPATELAALYAAEEFDAETVQATGNSNAAASGPRRRAMQYQMAAANGSPQTHARALKMALAQSQEDGLLSMMAAVLSDQLGSLLPRNGLEESAPEIIIGQLIIGEIDAAHIWLDLLSRPGSPVPARVERRLRSLVRIADPTKRITWQSGPALSFLDEDLRSGHQASAQFAAFELTILDALGHPVPQGFWERLLGVGGDWSNGYMPAPSILRQLEFASSKGRIGETVLLALVALGPDGPTGAHAETLWAVIRGLERVGLSGEARRIGVEALLSRARLWEE